MSKKLLFLIFSIALICYPSLGFAGSSQGEYLATSCGEVANVIEYMDGIKKYIFDADEDAVFKAGYCIGVLKEYSRSHGSYNKCNILDSANTISGYKGYGLSVRELLEKSGQ
ncbi:hypothetical protein [uncultured Pseudodesulfovibrio sp.]|uniref:hypothetical protein n=1 Tax=uncultured Pseudodesulfovibrio sp. TaxID=2035858 RepID=UPI0029C6F361|nr:hypothetical protein [uncultured Pseudodesulfovibrio sp.]